MATQAKVQVKMEAEGGRREWGEHDGQHEATHAEPGALSTSNLIMWNKNLSLFKPVSVVVFFLQWKRY